MIHGQPLFERTQQNKFIALALDRSRPRIRSVKVRACKGNEQGQFILSGGFLRDAALPSKFWQVPIELWHEESIYGNDANFHLALLHPGQN